MLSSVNVITFASVQSDHINRLSTVCLKYEHFKVLLSKYLFRLNLLNLSLYGRMTFFVHSFLCLTIILFSLIASQT